MVCQAVFGLFSIIFATIFLDSDGWLPGMTEVYRGEVRRVTQYRVATGRMGIRAFFAHLGQIEASWRENRRG